MPEPVSYSSYLQLDKILDAQTLKSTEAGTTANDEMLFIITHQSYELWFKQILFEINLVRDIFLKPQVVDNSPDLMNIVHKLKRVTVILEMLINKIDILETMTPLDFLDFRDLLRPASGFQSKQFKQIEASLGLKFEKRFQKNIYDTLLTPSELDQIKKTEKDISLLELIIDWLERMPFCHINFWEQYREIYQSTLLESEKQNIDQFNKLFLDNYNNNYYPERRLSPKANRHALFIMLYRDYPLLQLPYKLINILIKIDSQLGQWRSRHLNMVKRMIGNRMGTGGSSGVDYLKTALESHYIFQEFSELTCFLIQRQKLPKLNDELEHQLMFAS
jgi:tryptophan 2,3-dioxygenase